MKLQCFHEIAELTDLTASIGLEILISLICLIFVRFIIFRALFFDLIWRDSFFNCLLTLVFQRDFGHPLRLWGQEIAEFDQKAFSLLIWGLGHQLNHSIKQSLVGYEDEERYFRCIESISIEDEIIVGQRFEPLRGFHHRLCVLRVGPADHFKRCNLVFCIDTHRCKQWWVFILLFSHLNQLLCGCQVLSQLETSLLLSLEEVIQVTTFW